MHKYAHHVCRNYNFKLLFVLYKERERQWMICCHSTGSHIRKDSEPFTHVDYINSKYSNNLFIWVHDFLKCTDLSTKELCVQFQLSSTCPNEIFGTLLINISIKFIERFFTHDRTISCIRQMKTKFLPTLIKLE